MRALVLFLAMAMFAIPGMTAGGPVYPEPDAPESWQCVVVDPPSASSVTDGPDPFGGGDSDGDGIEDDRENPLVACWSQTREAEWHSLHRLPKWTEKADWLIAQSIPSLHDDMMCWSAMPAEGTVAVAEVCVGLSDTDEVANCCYGYPYWDNCWDCCGGVPYPCSKTECKVCSCTEANPCRCLTWMC